jgi:hypothetical protein
MAMPTRLVPAYEGLSHDSLTAYLAIILEDILPSALRPHTHKPDFILEPMYVRHLNARRRYSSIRMKYK